MLVNMKEMLNWAKENDCAIGAFNCATLESARAAIMAAETLNVPIVIQHAEAHRDFISLNLSGQIMIALAKDAKVPVCVHLDHGGNFEDVATAIRLGFTSVMYDASTKPYEQNIEETKFVSNLVHHLGMTIEAELGNMPSNLKGDLKEYKPEDFYTNPQMAKRFVEETGVDALAISFGTVHGLYKTTPKLSIEVIEKVRKATGDLPLVMHGGSGLTDEDYRNAIKAGIRKINYYTYEALAGANAIYEIVKEKPSGLLFHDFAKYATEKMYENLLKVMRIFYNK
jgi:fructose-bisphosphate aldolase class II